MRQHVGIVACPQFRGRVVCKYAPFPWMMHRIEQETAVWERVTAQRGDATRYWAPRFLGHVSEEGRVIGFLMEFISGHFPRGEGDREVCSKALEKLHGLGMKHSDIHRGSFVVRREKGVDEAVLVDLQMAVPCRDAVELVGEQTELGRCLRPGLGTRSDIRIYEDDNRQDE